MKRIALILAFSLLAAFPAAAQEKPKTDAQEKPKADAPKTDAKAAPLPSADEILEKYIKALGGKETIEKVTSRCARNRDNFRAGMR